MARNDDHPLAVVLAHPTLNAPRKSTYSASEGDGLVFDVFGTPAPQGSKKAFARTNKTTGKTTVSLVESAGDRLKEWRSEVHAAAMVAKVQAGWAPVNGPVMVEIMFYLPRPKAHYGSGRNAGVLKDWVPAVPTTRPDGDKLARAVLDALTSAAVYVDDSQVVDLHASKRFADGREPGASITVWVPEFF